QEYLARTLSDQLRGRSDDGPLPTWLNILSPREARRFLESHPELLDSTVTSILERTIADFRAHLPTTRQEVGSTSEQIKQINYLLERLNLLREVKRRGGTLEAIRAAYVNAHGGLALDVPDWLEMVEDQLDTLNEFRRPDRTAADR